MIGVILTGHGNFATGMESAAQLIVGKKENLVAVDFKPGSSDTDLKNELGKAFDKLASCSHIVVLTDLMGGTPFKTSAMLSVEHKNSTVTYGANLPMVLELCMSMADPINDIEDFIDKTIQIGKEQINKFVFDKVQGSNNEDEGI
ncbi:PTS mannose transporter subunit IIA [Tepidanaerobacter syntrophicus]|uniref:PTS system, N-acetylgalactosamine-specific IIA component n=1 Tax=Tepidanaerobacter syntrophicus TaxID=224999 RepID=A0A0U9HE61_9FIRM|nr:PTS galactosamine/N-acetylgalactosamine transporter subunit IIA [Tepidanaerobacter syntrophicus]GAQ24790.1 PTS system, N-acetylgalactosamine-specific IIA component [Tepidanaerobacter syntrophicus]GLI18942.1 PTS mannose transporter subunit IIA [Tepidanaerobacter syntrophicus]GLI51192.1 PTS mannose transporter subunit IIA [Tepidanaerobacter syntrophicus]HHV83976.1 PTS sugar transporter subunit IIA [Tepidanaerobacter syntrophicus]